MSDKRTIPVLQGFSLDEVTEGSQGAFVALTLKIPSRRRGGKSQDIDIGIPLEMAAALGDKLSELSAKLQSSLH